MIHAFLLIGQSNMAGRGELGILPPIVNPHVHMFRDNVWQMAAEPVHLDKPAIAGEGMATSFGDTLQQKWNADIGVIPCAMGGTSLAEWREGDALFQNAVARTQSALQNGAVLKGILWHQGEGDTAQYEYASTYAARFTAMVDALRAALSVPILPIVVGEIGTFLYPLAKNPYAQLVNEQLRSLPRIRGDIACVSSQGLTHKGDVLHFDAASVREMGLRYAAAWMQLAQAMDIRLQ